MFVVALLDAPQLRERLLDRCVIDLDVFAGGELVSFHLTPDPSCALRLAGGRRKTVATDRRPPAAGRRPFMAVSICGHPLRSAGPRIPAPTFRPDRNRGSARRPPTS